ncbi:DUF6538 domain-containing protein [Pseudochrobactrum sp. HB0163]|uniref:DUF6538 domain-containing protein n=1 Tax=Pseudochrobactrum sp. HB0163 TaxID=3450708 RepID=UPI003F6E2522
MGRRIDDSSPDRHLTLIRGIYYYRRRVPASVAARDKRAPVVKQSLTTTDLVVARAKRDLLEKADGELWASLVVGGDATAARAKYDAAVKRVEALGFTFHTAREIASEPLDAILKRIEALLAPPNMQGTVASAVLGSVDEPKITLSKAFHIYRSQIAADQLRDKSEAQRRKWQQQKQSAVNYFIEINEDKPIDDITRADALKLYNFWLQRIAPEKGEATHSATAGNRIISDLRIIYGRYYTHIGKKDRDNPFADLGYVEKKKSRPPFTAAWIREKILIKGALAGMNDEARGVVLALIETGARPSEICNLLPEHIHANAEVPYIEITSVDEGEGKREIKTESSKRQIPLVGVAVEVFKKHPNGFPRYRHKETHMSNTLNKYFKNNDLFPTEKHKIYSFRHAFEDRMKEAGLDAELRRLLMGHTIDRPNYGAGGSLHWRHAELSKIALPFDSEIV